MNLLCEFEYSNYLIRIPIPKDKKELINDFIYKWDSWNQVFSDITNLGAIPKESELNAMDLAGKAHWASIWPVYNWVIGELRKIKLLSTLPNNKELEFLYGDNIHDHIPIRFCTEDRLDLMAERCGWDNFKTINYEDLL